MSRLMRERIYVTRDFGGGYYQGGEWVEGTNKSKYIQGGLQPFDDTGKQRKALPAGVTARDALLLFTKEQMYTVNQHNFTQADRITVDGLVYLAVESFNWSLLKRRSSHYEVLFVKEDKVPNGSL